MIKYAKLFLIVFIFTILIVPLCHINHGERLESENRMLEKFPRLRKKHHLNYEYGKEFDAWLNDRFFGRKALLNIYKFFNRLNICVRSKKAVYFKSNGWMFTKPSPLIKMKKEKLDSIANQIKEASEFCKKHHIKMYVLAVPSKNVFYREYIADQYMFPEDVEQHLSEYKELEKQLGHIFIFPYDELKKASENELVFFKESHHWTEYGAYIAYLKLMESVQKDFKGVHPVSLENYKKFTNNLIRDDWCRDFNIGNTTELVNIHIKYAKKHILKEKYTYYDPLYPIEPEIRDISKYRTKKYVNPKGKYKVFLTGFSHNENLLQFLPYTFKEVNYYRLNYVKNVSAEEEKMFFKRYEKDLLEYKPDILIFTVMPWSLFASELWERE